MEPRLRSRVLFVRPWESKFIERDFDLLNRHFEVKLVDFVMSLRNPLATLRTLVSIVSGLIWCDVSFSWFGGFHALLTVRLAQLLRRSTIVVIGGYEVAYMPEIGYGAMLDDRLGRQVRYVLNHATLVLAVSEFSKREMLRYVESPGNVKVVYNGVERNDAEFTSKSENLVITVATGITDEVIMRKGLECFVESARLLPDVNFALIGKWTDKSIVRLKRDAPRNLVFTGFVSDDELIEYYKSARVYCQLSLHESFGVALAEAMSYGCVPVVTNQSALPEVVGDSGYYVSDLNPHAVAAAIKSALESNMGADAQNRILSHFTLDMREDQLVACIRDLTDSKCN